jgi:hypothetical protein
VQSHLHCVVLAVKVQLKKSSKSAPGQLLKAAEHKSKSDAGQAADAVAVGVTSSRGSAAGETTADSGASKKKDKKGLKAAVELSMEQVTTLYKPRSSKE